MGSILAYRLAGQNRLLVQLLKETLVSLLVAGVLRIEFVCCTELPKRPLAVVGLLKGQAQGETREVVVWGKPERLALFGNLSDPITLIPQHRAVVGVRLGVFRVEANRLALLGNVVVRITLIPARPAEVDVRPVIVRVQANRLTLFRNVPVPITLLPQRDPEIGVRHGIVRVMGPRIARSASRPTGSESPKLASDIVDTAYIYYGHRRSPLL